MKKPAKKHTRGINRTHVTEQPHPDTRYVVRDRDWERVWGKDLTHAEAVKLKEQIAGRHLSRTVRFEAMPTDAEGLARCASFQPVESAAAPAAAPKKPRPAPRIQVVPDEPADDVADLEPEEHDDPLADELDDAPMADILG